MLGLLIILVFLLAACKKESVVEPDPEPDPEPAEMTIAEAYATLEPLVGIYDFTTTTHYEDVNGTVLRDTVLYLGSISIVDTLNQRIRIAYQSGASLTWTITEPSRVGSCYTQSFGYTNNTVIYRSYKHSTGTPCSLGILVDSETVNGRKW